MTAPYGRMVSSLYYAPRPYLRPRRRRGSELQDFDYGIIVLPRRFEQMKAFMRLVAPDDASMRRIKHNRPVTIAGYPADRPLGTLWRHSERLRHFTRTRLLYTVDTCPGHSGSPIFLAPKAGGSHTMIGVHTSGIVDELGRPYGCSRGTVLAPPGMMNSGVRVTHELIAGISEPEREAAGPRIMIRLP